jgi:anhydro-N-acetylmuramic acid kinase
MKVLGINTGTSVDGVDFALVQWDKTNLKNFKILAEKSFDFTADLRKRINSIINKQESSLEEISNLNFDYSYFILDLLKKISEENPALEFDLIGIHGQTIYHDQRSTLQIGEASVLSKNLQIPVISDFRKADLAIGGCGAPLMSFLDDKLLRSKTENIATLNIGGISNITIMEKDSETLAYDTGPGNILIDLLSQKLFQRDFDEGGKIASRGRVDKNFIENLYRRIPYFSMHPPKSTGRELFNYKFAEKLLDLGNKENIIASTTYLTAYSISQELKKFSIKKLYCSGGGTQNKFLMGLIKEANPKVLFANLEDSGLNSTYKEAVLFSLLAFTTFSGIPNNIPSSTGANKATILGKLSYA